MLITAPTTQISLAFARAMRESFFVSFPMTRRDALAPLYARMRDSKEYLERERDMPTDRNAKPQTSALQVAATLAGAGAVGYAAGRTGTTSFGTSGIPVGLTAGIIGLMLAKFGFVSGEKGKLLSAASTGSIAAWGAMWAAGQGSATRATKGDATPIVSGALPAFAQALGLGAGSSVQVQPQVSGFAPHRQMGAGGVYGRPLSEAELQGIQQISRRVGAR